MIYLHFFQSNPFGTVKAFTMISQPNGFPKFWCEGLG